MKLNTNRDIVLQIISDFVHYHLDIYNNDNDNYRDDNDENSNNNDFINHHTGDNNDKDKDKDNSNGGNVYYKNNVGIKCSYREDMQNRMSNKKTETMDSG